MPLNPPGIARTPLRRPNSHRPKALGPPDVYPQDPNQKEDELNAVHVKQGFTQSHASLVTEEYGSLVSKTDLSTPVMSKVLADLKAIQVKKEDANTLSDNKLRRQTINTKDNFWLVVGKNKPAVDNWFRDLSNAQKPFSQLLRKVPIFNKKEEVLTTLCENKVPMTRAVWYIKMSAAYTLAMSETNKTKKRQVPDASLEWTHTLIRFLKEQLTEFISAHNSTPSSSMAGIEEIKPENSLAYKQWIYCLELCELMYYQGLLDRQEFLQWILELVEKCRYPDDPMMRIVMPLVLQYTKEFVQNELLSRKLAYQCSKKITYMVNETEAINQPQHQLQQQQSAVSSDSPTPPVPAQQHPVISAFLELTRDSYTRFIILGLASVLQTITTDCATALVWHYFGENKTPSSLLGSPLDYLPNCAPSALPMPPRQNNQEFRHSIRQCEQFIKERSHAVEAKWSGDRTGQYSKTGSLINTILKVLEDLDGYVFERLDSSTNCLDSLYSRLFDPIPSGSGHDPSELASHDEAIVHTLCEWAVTSARSGDHRAFVVAKLLERRQLEICGESDTFDDKESEEMVTSSPTVFQSQLVHYLDTDAPTLENRQEFSHLVLLFYELICHDVFSHDAYLCQLISRGDLSSPMMEKGKQSGNQEEENKDDSFEESKIDGDLNNLLNQIKEGNQLEGPFSPPTTTPSTKEKSSTVDNNGFDVAKCCRHWQYLYHFPLPQDESSVHDCNQRHVLLYGVGKGRDETTKQVKKLTKDVTKLYSKKFSIDVSDGGKVKKHSKNDFIFESVAQKFQNLPYFYQHSVSHTCGQTALDMLTAFTNCNANYLPVPEYISFLFDLSGLALNIQAILDWSLQILKELPAVDTQLTERSSCLTRTYTTTLGLYIVGVLRRYHTIFILNPSDVIFAFDQLSKIAWRPSLPKEGSYRGAMLDCNSAEWCILAYLYDLSCNCSILKSREKFADLKRLFSTTACEPSNSTYTLTDKKFGVDYIANPKKKVDPLTVKLLIENPQNQYNLVCNILMEVCECNDTDKLNDIAILCCEFTAQCNSLSAEWLGALTALCNAGGSNAYHDLLALVSIEDQSIYNRLGIFVSILIARHCFQLQSFVISVAIPSLLKVWEDMKEGISSKEAETGARLSCHLLLKLFKTVEAFQPMFYTMGSPSPMPRPSTHASGIKYSCDRHLLSSAHRNITVGFIIAVLKAILVLGDSNTISGKSSSGGGSNKEDDDDFGLGISLSGGGRVENANLSDFAKHTLRQICAQEWVHDRCLQVPDDLLRKGTLLDHMLTLKQAQNLLRLICSPSNNARDAEFSMDDGSKRVIGRILENLDEWNLRISAVDLKLMYYQLNSVSSSEASIWLDNVASAIVDVFQLVEKDGDNNKDGDGPPERKRARLAANSSATSASALSSASSSTTALPAMNNSSGRKKKYSSVWMIPYLVKNLKFLQSRVLKVSGTVLERGNWSRSSRTMPLETTRMSLGHQPFLRLVLTCLKELDGGDPKEKKPDREEQKENLLQSLHTQLSTFLCFNKDEKLYNYEDPTARKAMQDALQLRFSLVGGLFDTICRSVASITDWCTLLVQLIARGVVDLTNNSDLFTHVLDMLTILIHSTLINDRETGQSERGDENRKHYSYHTLVKKLKKEIGEKNNQSIHFLRQLLPFPKMMCEVVVTEPFGNVADAKGGKVKGLHSDKKQGFQVCDKQKISPWDLLEGHKNPAPLSWAWFGAVKYERKPMKYEEIFHELKYADFSRIVKPNEYFLEAPPLPPEDVEPTTKDVKEEDNKAAQFSGMSTSDQSMMMNRGAVGNVSGMPMAAGSSSGGAIGGIGPGSSMAGSMGQMGNAGGVMASNIGVGPTPNHQMMAGGRPGVGNQFQPRMPGPGSMMAGGGMQGAPMGGYNNIPAANQQMMYAQQGKPMMPQQRPAMQQTGWAGGASGGGGGYGGGPQTSGMGGYQAAPPYGAQQGGMQQGGAIGSMGSRFGVPPQQQQLQQQQPQGMSGGMVGSGVGQSSKLALQNMLRTRQIGPNQYMGNNPGNPMGGSSGGAGIPPNATVGGSGSGGSAPFALPRQNFQQQQPQQPMRPTMRQTGYGGGGQNPMAGDAMGSGGGGGPYGGQQQQQQFGNNFGGQGGAGPAPYMMRQNTPSGYNPQQQQQQQQQAMMNRQQQGGAGMMGGGGYNNMGMNRLSGPGPSGGGYMQSAPNVTMGTMQQQQQQGYRPTMNMQQQQQLMQQQQQQQQQQRMQTPQLMAQLQRGPQNMGNQQQMNYQQQQQRF